MQGHTDNRTQVQTLSSQFRQSLDSLMKALSVCRPYFIRCFKPNDDKLSQVNHTTRHDTNTRATSARRLKPFLTEVMMLNYIYRARFECNTTKD